MIFISDTTPLNYLILIDRAILLKQLYQVVIVPEVVLAEMLEPGTPQVVRDWILHKPDWKCLRSASCDRP
jgi:predicted nucleic acid-binding protein